MCRKARCSVKIGALADRSRRQEDVGVARVDRQLDRKAPRRHRPEARRRQLRADGELALALGPDDRVHLGLEHLARDRREDELGLVARVDLVQLVLVVERDHLVGVLDEGHRRRDRERGRERAGAQLHVDRIAVRRRHHGRLRELPAGVVELGPDLRHRRVDVADLAADALAHLAFAGRGLHLVAARLRQHAAGGLELRHQRLGIGLGGLEREPVTGAAAHQLAVVLDPLEREVELGLDFAHPGIGLLHRAARRGEAAAGAAQLLVELARARFGVGELRFEPLDRQLVRRRVDLEQHLALLHQPVRLDRHLEHPAADLRHDVDHRLDDAHVGGRRREHVEQQDHQRQGDDRDGDDDHHRRGVPRQPLELEEDQPDEERVQAEDQRVHQAVPSAGPGLEPRGVEPLAQGAELRRQRAARRAWRRARRAGARAPAPRACLRRASSAMAR